VASDQGLVASLDEVCRGEWFVFGVGIGILESSGAWREPRIFLSKSGGLEYVEEGGSVGGREAEGLQGAR
jgi:hypothetical protein